MLLEADEELVADDLDELEAEGLPSDPVAVEEEIFVDEGEVVETD